MLAPLILSAAAVDGMMLADRCCFAGDC